MGDLVANAYVAVVEDDLSLRRSLARLLRASGFEAITYASAESFLADKRKPRLDCILLDIQMDGASGHELNERLAAQGSTVPVIYLTARPQKEGVDEAGRAPFKAYLRKTDPGDVVLSAVRDATEQNRKENPTSGILEGSSQCEPYLHDSKPVRAQLRQTSSP